MTSPSPKTNYMCSSFIINQQEKKTHSALVVSIKAPHLSDLPNITATYLPEVSARRAACPGAPFINIPVFCGRPANAAQHDKTALACHLTRPQTLLYN